ncbi:MAG: hypothetical protein OEY51_02950 [Cyclobacteriaceae bacterium]|nr:hypothetical protein [Cyclobacteriaceae bacterium]
MRKVWLFSPATDLFTLFIPVWTTWAICFLLPEQTLSREIPLWIWVVVVMCIDVSHVWSTLFRTYLDKEEFHHHKRLLTVAPFLAFILLLTITMTSISMFYTALAYFAVYHFLKQQYGFMRILQGRYGESGKKILSDTFVIYTAMIFPVIFWHINTGQNFFWFVEGDFISIPVLSDNMLFYMNRIGKITYFIVLGAWLAEEIFLALKRKNPLHYGKILWILTTAANWYLGIVFFNSDLAFTMTNVVAHGVPYIVLISLYVKRKKEIKQSVKFTFSKTMMIFFTIMAGIMVLAFVEEYFWDMLLYRDNPSFFQFLLTYPVEVLENPYARALAISFLALPQVTHYILDGFIWKANSSNPFLKEIVFKR